MNRSAKRGTVRGRRATEFSDAAQPLLRKERTRRFLATG